jgi:hypothetical protein
MDITDEDYIDDMSYRLRIDCANSGLEEASAEKSLKYLFDVDSDSPKSAQDLKNRCVLLIQKVSG